MLYYFVVSCKSFWLVAIFEVRFYIQSKGLDCENPDKKMMISNNQHALTK